jgi:hypothetical protein
LEFCAYGRAARIIENRRDVAQAYRPSTSTAEALPEALCPVLTCFGENYPDDVNDRWPHAVELTQTDSDPGQSGGESHNQGDTLTVSLGRSALPRLHLLISVLDGLNKFSLRYTTTRNVVFGGPQVRIAGGAVIGSVGPKARGICDHGALQPLEPHLMILGCFKLQPLLFQLLPQYLYLFLQLFSLRALSFDLLAQ